MSVVTTEEIRLMPLRYAIGKRPLSILLGWGELTYTRLIEGNTPSEAHAAELRRLVDDPAAYAHVLEVGRSRITDAAYTRSFKAVDELLADKGGIAQAMRFYAVADRFCLLASGDLTPSALQRLVYYAQGFSLALLDDPLFDELPSASAAGPAYDRITMEYSFNKIQSAYLFASDAAREESSGTPFDSLKAKQLDVVDRVYACYGKYSGQALSQMSRDESPWKKARKKAGVAKKEDCNEPISAKSMRKFCAKANLQ